MTDLGRNLSQIDSVALVSKDLGQPHQKNEHLNFLDALFTRILWCPVWANAGGFTGQFSKINSIRRAFHLSRFLAKVFSNMILQ